MPRDPDYVRRTLPWAHRYTSYFSPDVRGLDNVPRTGPVLVVGNHSCLFWMPDAWAIGEAVVERRGVDAPTYTLAYDLLFALPPLGRALRRGGIVPAQADTAAEALKAGAAVVAFPGGDHDACRPWADRDRVDFGRHRGFVRLALRCGVPVVPAAAYGVSHAVVVAARGEPLARRLGLHALRVDVLPLLVGPPFGIAPVLSAPLPARLHVEFLPAPDWSDLPPEAADDAAAVEACFQEVVAAMQVAIDRLRTAHPHPVAEGTAALARHALRRLPNFVP